MGADLDLQHVGLLLAPVVDLLDLGVHQHADDLGLRPQLLQLSLNRLRCRILRTFSSPAITSTSHSATLHGATSRRTISDRGNACT